MLSLSLAPLLSAVVAPAFGLEIDLSEFPSQQVSAIALAQADQIELVPPDDKKELLIGDFCTLGPNVYTISADQRASSCHQLFALSTRLEARQGDKRYTIELEAPAGEENQVIPPGIPPYLKNRLDAANAAFLYEGRWWPAKLNKGVVQADGSAADALQRWIASGQAPLVVRYQPNGAGIEYQVRIQKAGSSGQLVQFKAGAAAVDGFTLSADVLHLTLPKGGEWSADGCSIAASLPVSAGIHLGTVHRNAPGCEAVFGLRAGGEIRIQHADRQTDVVLSLAEGAKLPAWPGSIGGSDVAVLVPALGWSRGTVKEGGWLELESDIARQVLYSWATDNRPQPTAVLVQLRAGAPDAPIYSYERSPAEVVPPRARLVEDGTPVYLAPVDLAHERPILLQWKQEGQISSASLKKGDTAVCEVRIETGRAILDPGQCTELRKLSASSGLFFELVINGSRTGSRKTLPVRLLEESWLPYVSLDKDEHPETLPADAETAFRIGDTGPWLPARTDSSGRLVPQVAVEQFERWVEDAAVATILFISYRDEAGTNQVIGFKRNNVSTISYPPPPGWCQQAPASRNELLVCFTRTAGGGFDPVIKRFNDESAPASSLIIHPNTSIRVGVYGLPHEGLDLTVGGEGPALTLAQGLIAQTSAGVARDDDQKKSLVVESWWLLAPRGAEKHIKLEIKASEKVKAPNGSESTLDRESTVELLVNKPYSAAIRTGIAVTWLPWSRQYEVIDRTIKVVAPGQADSSIVVSYVPFFDKGGRSDLLLRDERWCPWKHIAPSLGVGLITFALDADNATKVNFLDRFLLGADVPLGKTFAITPSLVLAKVSRLKDPYRVGQLTTQNTDNITGNRLGAGGSIVFSVSPQIFKIPQGMQ